MQGLPQTFPNVNYHHKDQFCLRIVFFPLKVKLKKSQRWTIWFSSIDFEICTEHYSIIIFSVPDFHWILRLRSLSCFWSLFANNLKNIGQATQKLCFFLSLSLRGRILHFLLPPIHLCQKELVKWYHSGSSSINSINNTGGSECRSKEHYSWFNMWLMASRLNYHIVYSNNL